MSKPRPHASHAAAAHVSTLEARQLLSGGQVGNSVWNDLNADGVRQGGEPGVPGVRVQLFAEGQAEAVAETDTDARGLYRFDDVAAGRYAVRIVTPARWRTTRQDAGGRESLDSDVDASGRTGLFAVAAGEWNSDVDAGLLYNNIALPGSVHARVFRDGGDGRQLGSDPNAAGVAVQLVHAESGEVLRTARTDADGRVSFDGVFEGDYRLRFVAGEGEAFTARDVGGKESLDSDSDAWGRTEVFRVGAGESVGGLTAGLIAGEVTERGRRGSRASPASRRSATASGTTPTPTASTTAARPAPAA